MENPEIKACRGCGNPKPEIKTEAPKHNQVRCGHCDTRGPVCSTVAWAVVYWNALGSGTAGGLKLVVTETGGTKGVGISYLLAAFVKEVETTATGNAEYGYRKLKKREYAAYHHANGIAKAMRWCAKKLRRLHLAG